MNPRRFLWLFVLTAFTSPLSAQDAPPEVVQWIRQHAIPLAGADPALPDADLAALAPVLGEARVIGLGEGTHGTREFFQFRDRMVRWLARRGDLDGVIWETALRPSLEHEAALLDPDVPVSRAVILRGGLWNTDENLAMLTALRAHNLESARPVRFVGADIYDLDGSMIAAGDAAQRVGGDAQAAYAVMTDAFGADPAAICTDPNACEAAWTAMTADRARRFAEAAEWLADVLSEAGEPWTVTIPARNASDMVRWYLPFGLMSTSAPSTPMSEMDRQWPEAQRAAQRAADTLGAVLGTRDPAYWTRVAPIVTALADGAEVYRDSLDRAGRFAWDQTVRSLHARVGTGRYGDPAGLVGAADQLVAWLDLVHESLRRAPTHMDFDNYREVAMGRNVAQIAHEIGGDGRVVFAAHNGHVGYNPSITLARTSSGAFARQALGDDYLAIGTFFGTGRFQAYDTRSGADGWDGPRWRAFETEPPPGSVEAALLATGLDAFALDLRTVPTAGPVADWLRAPRPTRNVGNSYDPDRPDDFVESVVVPDGFDVLVFFRRTDRAVPTADEIERGSYDLGAE